MLLRKIDGEMNVQNGGFSEIAKWRRWRHAPWLTAMADIMDSCHHFSKRWHVTDVKNIAGDDQTTLMVHRNSANIACPFRFYVCLRLRDRYCCSAADGSGSCHAPAPSYFKEITCCRRKKLDRDDQTILMVHRNSANITCPFRFYVCLRLRDRYCCSAADGSDSYHTPAPSYFEEITRCRHKKLDWRWPGNPNGRSKFRNLGLFTFIRLQLTLRGRLLEIAQAALNRR